jgi:hypothetical protein
VDISCVEAGEPYEGVLITVDNATCTDAAYQANYFMWTVNDGTADLLVHNTSVFEYVPTEGEVYVVTGPLDYDFDEWKIQLRFETDVQSGLDISAPQVTLVEVVTPTVLKLQFNEDLEPVSAQTATNYAINNGIVVEQAVHHSIVKSQVFLTVSTLAGGSYELTVSNVADLVGNIMPESIYQFVSTGIGEEKAAMRARVFPNPSDGMLNLEWMGNTQENIAVRVFNLTGAVVYSGEFSVNGQEIITLDLEPVADGMYILEAHGQSSVARTRIMKY